VNPRSPQPKPIARAVDVVRGGGVVCFPTRCLYGLGADAFNPAAVERVFEIKQRPADLPLLVLISRPEQFEELAAKVPEAARLLMERFWPGRLTLVLEARPEVPPRLTAGTGKIGVRLAAHPVARALVEAVGRPITGTSANPSGAGGCRRIAELDPRIAGRVQLILDAGDLKGGVGSTVVDVTGGSPLMIREGDVSRSEILAVLKSV
jgi:L-threonylcarbamoyladenylate synthase